MLLVKNLDSKHAAISLPISSTIIKTNMKMQYSVIEGMIIQIYTKIVMNMTNLQVLEEKRFEYHGPIAYCGGGDDPEVEQTPEERELAQIAREKWQYYGEQFAPLENEYMQRVSEYGQPSQEREVVGQAAQGIQTGIDEQTDKAVSNLTASGIDPSSGKFSNTLGALAGQQGQTAGSAMNKANLGLQQQELVGMQNLVSLGQGKSTSAQAGLSEGAQQSTSEAIRESVNEWKQSQAMENLVGQGIGMAASYGMNKFGPNNNNNG